MNDFELENFIIGMKEMNDLPPVEFYNHLAETNNLYNSCDAIYNVVFILSSFDLDEDGIYLADDNSSLEDYFYAYCGTSENFC
jgi:hypothetical protein